MTREEIKRYVEDDIDFHMSETGICREDTYDIVLTNIILRYYDDEISKEELKQCADYLDYNLKFDEIEKQKFAHKVNKLKYGARRIRKRLGNKVRYSIGEDGRLYKTVNDGYSFWISKEQHTRWIVFDLLRTKQMPPAKIIGEDKAVEVAIDYGMDPKEFFEINTKEELKELVVNRKKKLEIETAYTGESLDKAVINSFLNDFVSGEIGEERLRAIFSVTKYRLRKLVVREECDDECC